MNIATIINAHSSSDVVLDTIDSLRTYITKDILLVIDGSSTAFNNIALPVHKLNGFVHNIARSPYKNMALGLENLYELFPESDWYCYCEYDCLFTSKRILDNLEIASKNNIWMLGNDGHVDDIPLPVVESLAKTKFKGSYYLLGACQFFSNQFLKTLKDMNFFEKLLVTTSPYTDGFFPLYHGYDISEHMYPTLARSLGGNIGVFANYDYITKQWHGCYEIFPVRWRPELDYETENYPEASIMHPLKDFSHPIREYHRNKRSQFKE